MPAASRLGFYSLIEPSERSLGLARSLRSPGELVALQALPWSTSREPLAAPLVEELALVRSLQLPGLVPLRDSFVSSPSTGLHALCLVHAYLPSWSLEDLLGAARRRREPVPLGVALALIVDVLWTLHTIHGARRPDGQHPGLLHRGLSPSGVLVDVQGQAHLWNLIGWRLRLLPSLRGSALEPIDRREFSFLTSEQASGEPLTTRSDLHRAAAVLWEMLTGRPRLEEPDLLGLLTRIKHATPVAPSRWRPQVPPALDELVLRTLSRAARDRPSDARVLADELARTLAPASRADVAAWASTLGADPWPGPEAYRLRATGEPPDESAPEPLARRMPYR